MIINAFVLIAFVEWPQSNMVQSRKIHNDKVKSKFEKDSIEYGKFTGNYKNDGVSGEFDGLTYAHSQEMLQVYIKYLIIFRQFVEQVIIHNAIT